MPHSKSSSGRMTSETKASAAKKELTTNAKKALKQKRSASSKLSTKKPSSKTAGKGMRPIPNKEDAPSGALEKEGHRPVLERSRKVR